MLFSIILPTYNRSHRIEKAIESVISQTYNNWELIIIDDGSTDKTYEVCKAYMREDSRIKYFYQKNSERCVSRNNGIKESNGDWICFLDSDDHHLPIHLELLRNNILSKGISNGFIFTNAWDETEEGIRTERNCPSYVDFNPYTYFLRYTVNPQRWCVSKNILADEQFDPEVIICEDMDTSLRIIAKGYSVMHIQERTTCYVAASDSFTHGDSNKPYKELKYLKRIFSRKELKGLLPRKETWRLLSMCYFHISQREREPIKKIQYSLKSFLLCFKGYNGKTNKIVLYTIISSLIQIIKIKK